MTQKPERSGFYIFRGVRKSGRGTRGRQPVEILCEPVEVRESPEFMPTKSQRVWMIGRSKGFLIEDFDGEWEYMGLNGSDE